jgi:outer membrane protein TolC
LLNRRPDVRKARADAAAQCYQIGVAESDYYPAIGVAGYIGYSADDLRHLFEESSFTGLILPNFQWKILNYGRILNNVRLQDSRFRERVLTYQQSVLTAGREVEDALAQFIEYQAQAKSLERSVQAAQRSVDLVIEQYKAGRADFNRVYTTQSTLVTQQDQMAAVEGSIDVSLIGVYKALGGGWQYFDHKLGENGCEAPVKLTGVEEEAGPPRPVDK